MSQKTLVTHNGTFHADDVFAVATFLLAHKDEDWKVVRSREKEIIEKADAVIDTGAVYDPSNLRFDHHQESGAGQRESGIDYAAFGLVWKEYGPLLCTSTDIMVGIDKKLVAPLDAHDNGISISSNIFGDVFPYDMPAVVNAFNPTWVEDQSVDGDAVRLETFLELVDFAKKIILREIKRAEDKKSAEVFVTDLYNNSDDKRVIIFDKFYPWQETILNYHEPLFVVYPNPSASTWTVKAVPKEKNSFECRKYFPNAWAGKENEDFEKVSGVAGVVFCHRNKFLVVTKTKESAIEIAKKASE